jgi:hypothetical protein
MDQPAFYQIRVQGLFAESWSDWLGGIAITPQANGETLLTGPIVDQAALHGILDKLYAMNLPLLALVRIKGTTDADIQVLK